MNSLRTNHRTSRRGFTLAEVMVALALVGIVSTVGITVLRSTLTLSSQNAVTNRSNFRARQMLDRIGEIVRFAETTPVIIKADGTPATGGSGDGIMMKNSLDGPYVFKNANGSAEDEIPAGARTFTIEYASAANVTVPEVGEFFILSLASHPDLEITSVGAVSGGAIKKVQVTTKTGLPDKANPGSYTVTGYRYRKEAYIFAQTGTQWSLRRYSKVTATTNFSNASSYTVLGTGFQKLGTRPFFTSATENGTEYCWLRAVARSSDHAEFVESESGKNALTMMPIQIKLWNYNAPPPPP